MIKKVIKTVIFFTVCFAVLLWNQANSAELYHVKPASFDISNSIIFIPVKSATGTTITDNLIYKRLDTVSDNISGETQKKNGVVLEISSAGMDFQPSNINFSEGQLKEFYIEQVGNNVKITMIFNDKYNLSNLKIGNINNNLFLTITPVQPYGMNYYINTYRESDYSKDYKECLVLTSKNIEKQPVSVNNANNSSSMNEINQAFASSTYNNKEVYTNVDVTEISKNVTLRSKYYLNNTIVQDNVFRITGAGTTCVQKPFVLDNPQRMVFDLPNTTINPKLHNHEFFLSNGDILKVAQFTPSTARVVVTSIDAAQYIPVYSPDSQSLIIANPRNILTTHLPKNKTNIVKFNIQKNNKTENFIMEFDKPLSYGIKRTSEHLYVYFLNAEKYNDNNYHSAVKNTAYADTKLNLLTTGMRLKVPLANKQNINTYISPDGKVFKITSEPIKIEDVKTPEEIQALTKKEGSIKTAPKYTDLKNHNVVVLDAGHGGKDCGALRDNITEKTITLDVCMKLQKILQKKGYKVYMTRTDDTYVSLEDRTLYTEGINPAAFVSVHVNACNAEAPRGIETHYYHDESLELADCVHKNLIKKVSNTANRGLLKSRFYVINHTSVPAILVEIGFISNDAERQELITPQRQQATAEGIAEGIIEFLKLGKY